MDITVKNFLKPTISKVLIFFVLVIFTFLVLYAWVNSMLPRPLPPVKELPEKCDVCINISKPTPITITSQRVEVPKCNLVVDLTIYSLLSMVVLIDYLLSCTIIFLYERYMTNRLNPP